MLACVRISIYTSIDSIVSMATEVICSIGHLGTLMIGEHLNTSSGGAFSDEMITEAIAVWNAQEPFVPFDEFDGCEIGEE